MRFRLVGALVATALLGIGATAAIGSSNIKSTVEITEGGPDLFAGTVSSKVAKCEKGRLVTLSYSRGPQEEVVGTDKTDRNGNWSIPGSYTAGDYTAEVAPKAIKKKGRRCKGDETDPERF